MISSNKQLLSNLASSVSIITIGVLLADPFDVSMSSRLLVVLCVLLAISLAIFGFGQWREEAADEREMVILDRASRIGYLSGISLLVIALIVQSFSHQVDFWLAGVLVAMIVSKQTYTIHKK